MKWVLVVSVAITACSSSVIVPNFMNYKEGDRYFYFPGDGDGKIHMVDALEPVDEEFIINFAANPANNGYWLYTRDNPNTEQYLVFGDGDSVLNSNYNPNKDTVFLVHGWNGNGANGMNTLLKSAFLQSGDVNVIVVDWSDLARRNYITAMNGVPTAGKSLGEFINWLTTLGASYESMHLVGFSLGGHLVGSAGRTTNSLVRRITSLDPAGPLWGINSQRIVPNDAQYVEVIHTNTGLLGYTNPCGHSDHYPNGGSRMPGCTTTGCSHGRAYEYMASTVIHNNLKANKCETLRDATRNRCTGDLYAMGNDHLNKTQYGIFRVNTERDYPF